MLGRAGRHRSERWTGPPSLFPSSFPSAAAFPRETERYVRTGGSSDTRIHAAHRSQREYRQLGSTPAWRDEVFSGLPDDLRCIARKNAEAHDALVGLRGDSPPPKTLPAWRILAPAPASDASALVRYNNHTQHGVAVLAYAEVLRADPDAYLSHHSWQVNYATRADDHLLPVGYAEPNPVPAEEHLGREAVPVAH
ncbi:MAG: hypothetical protein ACI9AD_000359 [Nitriliruptoraceae bacterium]|jgi:hypothetical protein